MHRNILRRFAQTVGNRPVRNLSPADVERWLRTRHHCAAGTVRLELVTIRGFAKWLRRHGHVQRDVFRDVRMPRLPRSVPRSLGAAEVDALVAVLPDDRAHAIVALMLGLGLRRAEVAGLQAGDWDREAETLVVVGKGGHARMLPVPARVAAALNRYRPRLTSGPLIQRLDELGPLSPARISDLMSEWMLLAGIKAGPYDGKACHSLRHTLATNVADVEPDLRVVQQVLGHASLVSTQVYLRGVETGRMRAALEAVA